MQAIASGGNIGCVVVRLFAAAHNDMAVRITAGLVNGHLTVFIRRQEHVAGACGTNRINGNARIAIGAIFEANRAGKG
ncbi:hypothetical protein D3C75_931510 [compost metagenome]